MTDSLKSLTEVRVYSYGYRGRDARSNLCVLPSGELVYFVATFVVVYDRLLDRQRHYTEHNEEVTWYASYVLYYQRYFVLKSLLPHTIDYRAVVSHCLYSSNYCNHDLDNC